MGGKRRAISWREGEGMRKGRAGERQKEESERQREEIKNTFSFIVPRNISNVSADIMITNTTSVIVFVIIHIITLSIIISVIILHVIIIVIILIFI